MYDYLELFRHATVCFAARTLNLIGFLFIVQGDVYYLHCQCLVRILDKTKLIVSSEDVYLPASDYDGDEESWNWSESKHGTLFDEQISHISGYRLTVKHAEVSDCGDIYIDFDNGMRLEVIVTTLSKNEPWNESWRFFREDDEYEDLHVVCYGTEIVQE